MSDRHLALLATRIATQIFSMRGPGEKRVLAKRIEMKDEGERAMRALYPGQNWTLEDML